MSLPLLIRLVRDACPRMNRFWSSVGLGAGIILRSGGLGGGLHPRSRRLRARSYTGLARQRQPRLLVTGGGGEDDKVLAYLHYLEAARHYLADRHGEHLLPLDDEGRGGFAIPKKAHVAELLDELLKRVRWRRWRRGRRLSRLERAGRRRRRRRAEDILLIRRVGGAGEGKHLQLEPGKSSAPSGRRPRGLAARRGRRPSGGVGRRATNSTAQSRPSATRMITFPRTDRMRRPSSLFRYRR